jgi:hypothetical protein
MRKEHDHDLHTAVIRWAIRRLSQNAPLSLGAALEFLQTRGVTAPFPIDPHGKFNGEALLGSPAGTWLQEMFRHPHQWSAQHLQYHDILVLRAEVLLTQRLLNAHTMTLKAERRTTMLVCAVVTCLMVLVASVWFLNYRVGTYAQRLETLSGQVEAMASRVASKDDTQAFFQSMMADVKKLFSISASAAAIPEIKFAAPASTPSNDELKKIASQAEENAKRAERRVEDLSRMVQSLRRELTAGEEE